MSAVNGPRVGMEQAHQFAEALWGHQSGWVSVMLGYGGRYREGQGYTFERTESAFARWPTDRDEMLQDLIAWGQILDVFVAPLLRSEQSRRKGTGIPSTFLYADVDHGGSPPNEAQAEALESLSTRTGTLLVGSGSQGNTHLYVPLQDRPASLESFVLLNRRLALTVGADAGWSDNKVLRLPGTYNHKARALGRESLPVVLRVAP